MAGSSEGIHSNEQYGSMVVSNKGYMILSDKGHMVVSDGRHMVALQDRGNMVVSNNMACDSERRRIHGSIFSKESSK